MNSETTSFLVNYVNSLLIGMTLSIATFVSSHHN